MKKVLFLIVITLIVGINTNKAQSSFILTTDFQSRYVWRGLALGGPSPSIQPSMTYSYKNFSANIWGAFSLSSSAYQELDLYFSYNIKNIITFVVTDYDNPRYDKEFHYFNYDKDSTSHVLEGGIILNVPKTNLSLGVYTNFYGNDKKDNKGNIVYSTYSELKYNYDIKKINTMLDFTCGFAFNDKKDGFYGNDGFGCVNLAFGVTKQITLSNNFSLPVYSRIIASPVNNKLYFLCGTTITL